MGGEGKVIEADETYLGKRDGKPSKPDSFVSGFGWVKHPKIETQRKIVALVERGGAARSFVVDNVNKATIRKILFTNADRKSTLMTDEASVYPSLARTLPITRPSITASTNMPVAPPQPTPLKAIFSIFKRGMVGLSACQEAICIAIWRSLISAIAIARRWKLTMQPAPRRRSRALWESV